MIEAAVTPEFAEALKPVKVPIRWWGGPRDGTVVEHELPAVIAHLVRHGSIITTQVAYLERESGREAKFHVGKYRFSDGAVINATLMPPSLDDIAAHEDYEAKRLQSAW